MQHGTGSITKWTPGPGSGSRFEEFGLGALGHEVTFRKVMELWGVTNRISGLPVFGSPKGDSL